MTTTHAETSEPRSRAVRAAHVLESPLRGAAAVATPLVGRYDRTINRISSTAPARVFGRHHAIFAVVLYLLGAALMQRNALAHLSTQISGNIVGDPTQYMWAMWWWPHAILHGVNPFVTHAIWAPDAYNTGSITSTPTLSLLFAPLNFLLGWTQGPVITYNLSQLLAPILTAWFTYRLCLRLSGRPAAAIAGGWLYGFSTYGLSQLQGHLQLVYTYLIPLLLLLAIRRLDGDLSRRRYVILSAIGIIAEIGIGTEILFTGTCMLAVVWLASLLLAPSERRRAVLSVGLELIGAYLLAAVICSPFLAYALTGPEVEANSNSVLKMADLLAFVIPTQLVRFSANRFSPVSALFTEAGGVVENGAYIGVFLIGGAVAFIVGNWRSWGTRVLAVSTAVAVLWALGSTLTIAGQSTVWLPWRLLEYRSPFNEVTPVRIAGWVELGAAVAFSLWLARPGRVAPLRWLVALVAAVMIFPNVNGVYPNAVPVYKEGVASPPFITTGLYRRYLTPNEVVLPLPFGPYGNSLLWQAQDQGYYRLASGWFGFIPDGYANTVAGQELMDFRGWDNPVASLRAFIAHAHVGAVVAIPDESFSWPITLRALGLHPVAVGGVEVWKVPLAMQGRGR